MMRRLFALTTVPLILLAACASRTTPAPASTPSSMMGMGMEGMEGMMQRHMAAIPVEYAELISPIPPDAASLARGKAIYDTNCAVCHGDGGWGDGPAAASLDPAPAPIAHTAQMLSDGYLFYRISEGGGFAPFASAMPPWKETLSETERWDVINYIRSLGGGNMVNGGMMGSNLMDMMGWMMAPWWFLGWVLVIGVIAAVALAIVWTVRRSQTESPLTILKRRYARGEINSEQFEGIKRKLDGEDADESKGQRK